MAVDQARQHEARALVVDACRARARRRSPSRISLMRPSRITIVLGPRGARPGRSSTRPAWTTTVVGRGGTTVPALGGLIDGRRLRDRGAARGDGQAKPGRGGRAGERRAAWGRVVSTAGGPTVYCRAPRTATLSPACPRPTPRPAARGRMIALAVARLRPRRMPDESDTRAVAHVRPGRGRGPQCVARRRHGGEPDRGRRRARGAARGRQCGRCRRGGAGGARAGRAAEFGSRRRRVHAALRRADADRHRLQRPRDRTGRRHARHVPRRDRARRCRIPTP